MVKNRKTTRIMINDLLKTIDLAVIYAHDSDVFYNQAAKMLNYQITDDEIEGYCVWYLTEEADLNGYDKSDYESAKERLEEFREYYCNIKENKKKK